MAKSKPEQPVLTWRNETRRLSDLIPWPKNPRQIKGESVRRLQESLEEFNQVELIACGPDGEIYNGHQRLKAWAAKFGKDLSVEVRVASRPLTEHERKKLIVILHRGAVGEWNFEELANSFDFDELVEWGFDAGELLGFNDTITDEKGIETIPEKYMIIIECENEQSQAELLERFETEGLKCRALL